MHTIDTVDAKLAQLQERRNALVRQQQEKSVETERLRGDLATWLENFEGADADAEQVKLSARIGALGVERDAITPVIAKLDAELASLGRQRYVLAAQAADDAHEAAIADARAACLPIQAAVRTFVSATLPPLMAALGARRAALVQAARASRIAAERAGVAPRHTIETVNLVEKLPLNVGQSLRALLELADTYRQMTEYVDTLKKDRTSAAA